MFSRKSVLVITRLLVALLFLAPLWWMVTASFQPPDRPLPTRLQLFPDDPTWHNYRQVGEIVALGRYLLNSLLVVALGVPLSLVTGSWAGLAMARLPRPDQRLWVIVSLAVLMVPGVALWSTRFLIYRTLGWHDTLLALIAPAWMGTSPFYVLMFYRAFRRIPTAVYESAWLEGAGVLQLWARVALPMARPTVVAVALLSVVFYWGDFISPLLYLNSEQQYTLPVALQLLQQLPRPDWGLLTAAAVLVASLPVLLFLLVQPYFVHVQEEIE